MVLSRGSRLVPAIFLHTQKTAGTSLVEMAGRHYGMDMVSHGQYLGLSYPKLKKISFISGHFGYEFARPLLPSRFSFTFLRDPIDRVLSYYYFCRTCDPREYPIYRLAQQLDREQFLRAGLEKDEVRCFIWNQQTWQLACGYGDPQGRWISDFTEEELLVKALEHMGQLSYVGFTETFEHDSDVILDALEMPHRPKKFAMNRISGRPTKHALSPIERSMADELTHLDRELYRAVWGRYRPDHPLPLGA